ncbi:MAG: hypothetical protein ACREYA_03765 [Cupriavidus necator]
MSAILHGGRPIIHQQATNQKMTFKGERRLSKWTGRPNVRFLMLVSGSSWPVTAGCCP